MRCIARAGRPLGDWQWTLEVLVAVDRRLALFLACELDADRPAAPLLHVGVPPDAPLEEARRHVRETLQPACVTVAQGCFAMYVEEEGDPPVAAWRSAR